MDLLFDLQARSGTTLLLITHDQRLAEQCGRQVQMDDGRLTGGLDLAPGQLA